MNTLYSSVETKLIMRQAGLELADTTGCTDQEASGFINQQGYVDSSFRSLSIRPQSIENLRAERRASSFQTQKFPAEHSQTYQASSTATQHNQPRPTLRRTPSGRGLHGANVAALDDRLKQVAIANPLPKMAIDFDGKTGVLGYSGRVDAGKQFAAAHGADLVKNNIISIYEAVKLVNAESEDCGTNFRVSRTIISNKVLGIQQPIVS